MNELRIIVGAGGTYQPGWISLDESDLDVTRPDQWAELFEPSSIDRIMAEHVWEHMTIEEGKQALHNAWRYLKRGGVIRIAVPDGYHPDSTYIDWVRPGTGFNGDDHKVLYDLQSLTTLMMEAGFLPILREFFNFTGEFFSDIDLKQIDRGIIYRTPQNFWGNVLSLYVGTEYTSLVIDGVKI